MRTTNDLPGETAHSVFGGNVKATYKQTLVAIFSAACASCVASGIEQRPASSLDPNSVCVVEPHKLAELKSRALDYLLKETPTLKRECAAFSSAIEWNPVVGCLLSGEILVTDNCPAPAHAGYQLAFDPDTMEPYRVYWLARQ